MSKSRSLHANLVAAIGITLFSGCSAPLRPIMTDAQLQEHSLVGIQEMQATFYSSVGQLLERIEKGDDAQVVDLLAISGGGDYGAFGAGFLVGWGRTEDPAARRPEFDVVTGVSTGALLSPFAYIGTDEACEAVETLYRHPRSDWVFSRGLFFFLPSNPSFMVLPGLERDLRTAVTKEFVAQMAERSKKGALLAVSATDLDYGRQQFWDLGVEAQKAHEDGNLDRVQRRLLASAAIPAVFPPIEIDGSLYADGGVTANVFVKLDHRSPGGLIPRWRKAHPDRPLPKIRQWIIFNNQTAQPPKTVQAKWPEVMTPSLTTSVRYATLAEIRWLTAEVDLVNATLGTDIEVRLVSIPNDWRAPVVGDFKEETMNSLADLGRKMGADPKSWVLLAAPGSHK